MPRQAGVRQIDITPEMVAAGANELACYDESKEPLGIGVEKILIATLESAGFLVTGCKHLSPYRHNPALV